MPEIESGVPIPGLRRPGAKSRWMFETMEVGDSFSAVKEDAARVRLAASARKREHPGWDYTTRKDGDGIRLWRVA